MGVVVKEMDNGGARVTRLGDHGAQRPPHRPRKISPHHHVLNYPGHSLARKRSALLYIYICVCVDSHLENDPEMELGKERRRKDESEGIEGIARGSLSREIEPDALSNVYNK